MCVDDGSVTHTYKNLWGQNVTEVQEALLGSGKQTTPFDLLRGSFLNCKLRMMTKLLALWAS